MIDTDKFFTEITDESRGTIGYHVSNTSNLIQDILKQNKQLQELKEENKNLKEGWYNSTKCHHLVLDECSLTAKTCKGLQKCFKQSEEKLKKIASSCTLAPAIDSEELADKILKIIESEEV